MLAVKRGVKADPKVFKLLEDIKKKREKKQEVKERKEFKSEQKRKEIYEEARKLVHVVNLEHGVSTAHQKNYIGDYLKPLDSVKELEEEIPLVNISEFEEFDKVAVNSIFKKYNRLFKTYFI